MDIVDESSLKESGGLTSKAGSRNTEDHLPWVEKYRPKELGDLVAHEAIVSILDKLIESNKLPHLLFHGPPGTGKTSTIKAAAKKMYGPKYASMILELNASDARGIDVVRDQIKEFAGTRKLFSTGVKLVVLDEADNMTNDAQAALRRIIEKYTENTRFCMICNYVNKITPALQSRCTKFRFAPLKPEQIIDRLNSIVTQEQVNISPDGIEALLELSGGDMRRVLNLLQSATMSYNRSNQQITANEVYLTAGAATPQVIDKLYLGLMTNDFTTAHSMLLEGLTQYGYALVDIVQSLSWKVLETSFPDEATSILISKLSDIEYRLSKGCRDSIQVGAVVGAFIIVRHKLIHPDEKEDGMNVEEIKPPAAP